MGHRAYKFSCELIPQFDLLPCAPAILDINNWTCGFPQYELRIVDTHNCRIAGIKIDLLISTMSIKC
jgi:hypothetical protein